MANELTVAYAAAVRAAKEDLATSNETYRRAQSEFLSERNRLIGIRWAELAIIYTLVTMLSFFVLPMLSRRRVSPIYLLLKAAAVTKNGDVAPAFRLFVNFIFRFASFFVVIYLIPVLLYGRNSSLFFRYSLFHVVPMTALWILSLLLLIVSLSVSATDRTSHRTLADRLFGLVYKDLR